MTGALVDTGFLVALFRRSDVLRAAAREYLRQHTHPLVTVSAVIVEACFFLDAAAKANLLEWALRGGVTVADVPVDAYSDIKTLIAKYADRDVDFTDAALVWFAGMAGCRSILTVDAGDFAIYRLKGNRRFDVVPWTDERRKKH